MYKVFFSSLKDINKQTNKQTGLMCCCRCSLSLSLSLSHLWEAGEQVQDPSLLHGAGVVQVLLLQVDLHPVLFGQSGVLRTKRRRSVESTRRLH